MRQFWNEANCFLSVLLLENIALGNRSLTYFIALNMQSSAVKVYY